MNAHPLDRPVWNALTTRQAALGIGADRARRFRPEINLFVAAAEPTPEAMAAAAALVDDRPVAMVEGAAFPVPPGLHVDRAAALDQMIATAPQRRLVAMAGERLKVPGFIEITAVCTHPDFRGRGHAKRLILHQLARIQAQGETGFLHSYPDNDGAIALYESLGFRLRAKMDLKFLVRRSAL